MKRDMKFLEKITDDLRETFKPHVIAMQNNDNMLRTDVIEMIISSIFSFFMTEISRCYRNSCGQLDLAAILDTIHEQGIEEFTKIGYIKKKDSN